MGRAPCCDKTKVKKGPWSPEEDAILKTYLQTHGHSAGNWIALPQRAGLNRCGKSCRLRWLNYLRPDIRHGGFTEEEDNIILTLYSNIGSRWSVIASHLRGRTDNDVKNYWNTKLKKKLLASKTTFNNTSSGSSFINSSTPSPAATFLNQSLDNFSCGSNLQALSHDLPYYENCQETSTSLLGLLHLSEFPRNGGTIAAQSFNTFSNINSSQQQIQNLSPASASNFLLDNNRIADASWFNTNGRFEEDGILTLDSEFIFDLLDGF